MKANLVRLAVDVTVNQGQLDAFKAIAKEMTSASEAEPETLGYEFFFSTDEKQCRLLETYEDANAVLAHFTGPVVGKLVPQITPLCTIDRFEIYGDPGPQVTQMAASLGAKFFSYWAGLSR